MQTLNEFLQYSPYDMTTTMAFMFYFF